MTEAEAKTRWCPFVRLTDGTSMYFTNRGEKFGGNTGKNGADAALCLGSACMAWRVATGPSRWSVTRNGETQEYHWNPTGFEGYEKATITPIDNNIGYCGLAGRP
jgi:hypothetical protein